MRPTTTITGILILTCLVGAGCHKHRGPFEPVEVKALRDTTPVPSKGDAADDPAIWINRANPENSAIIGTNKKDGLAVYTLYGRQQHYYSIGLPNNVDVRYDFPLSTGLVDIVVTEDRAHGTVRVFAIHPETLALREISFGSQSAGMDVYGMGLYHDRSAAKHYVFVGSKSGEVRQFELVTTDKGTVILRRVRTMKLESQVEGIVADDELGVVYIGEERTGIWRFGAHPDAPGRGTLIAPIGTEQPLQRPDVEGLAIYTTGPGTGYLVASSQGANEYVIFRREEPNAYVGTFRVVKGIVDGTTNTDGLDATSHPLSDEFPRGLVVVQDGRNSRGNQNFKLIPWNHIADAFSPPLD